MMDRHIDLTDDSAFSSRRVPKVIRFGRTPWSDITIHCKQELPWKKHLDSCERCGACIKNIPWENNIPDICERCAGLLFEEKRVPWKEDNVKDGYNDVFLIEYRGG